MADESGKKRLVRFDFPGGLDAAAIAQALREHGRRILDDASEQRRGAAWQALPDASPSRGPGQAEGRLPEEPGADTQPMT